MRARIVFQLEDNGDIDTSTNAKEEEEIKLSVLDVLVSPRMFVDWEALFHTFCNV